MEIRSLAAQAFVRRQRFLAENQKNRNLQRQRGEVFEYEAFRRFLYSEIVETE